MPKTTPFIRKLLCGSSLLFLSICSFAILIYSIFEISDTETDDIGLTIDCGSDPYSTNEPLRFRQTSETEYVECGWPWTNTIFRLITCSICCIFPFLTIIFGLIKKKKWVMWTSSLLSIGAVVLYVGSLVIDFNDVRSSLNWCKDYTLAESCSYSPFFGMLSVEIIIIVFWVLEGVGLLYYCSRCMKNDFADFKFDYEDSGYYSS